MDIAKSLRVALARDRKSQTWLADQMGTSRAYASAICNGSKQLSTNRLRAVSSIFGVPVSEFIKWGE